MTTEAPRSRAPYLIAVSRVQDMTPHLRRITFTAPDLRYYPANAAAAHIKVFCRSPARRSRTCRR